VFALANPDPKLTLRSPALAAIVASGRSDEPNQINNVLAFPESFVGYWTSVRGASPKRSRSSRAGHRGMVKDSELSPNTSCPGVHANVVTTVAAVEGALRTP